ncbi:site-specific integrase [Haloparvum sedimenti]|uniref:site-specific integrase n=1 Tax=Haloparvum sedimenti TaxID=1678448 RepID=UPI00071E7856|nr:site-specific integrase [Haloparvum sedimenti]
MTDQPESAVARNVKRCQNRDGMSEADAEALLEAHRHMELLGQSEVSPSQHSDVLMRGVKMAREVGGLADALEDREAAEEIVRWINREYDNEETNRGYRKCLRAYGRHALGVDETPESLEWVPAGYSSTYDPAPDPAKMLTWDEHIKPMIAAANNVRDEALIALCWDLGPRTSELHELQVNNITDGEYGLRVSIENGKNGSRSPTIVKSVPYVSDWLERHPGGPEDYLWSRLQTPTRVSRNYLRDTLYRIGRQADTTLPAKPTPTRLRKSSASYLASQNVNQAFLEDHHGWTRGSDNAARYIAVFGSANDRAIAAAHGVDVSVDDNTPTMQECVRCEFLNEADRSRCRRCGQALNQEAVEAEDRRQDRLNKQLAMLDEEKAIRLLSLAERLDDPEVLERLDSVSE